MKSIKIRDYIEWGAYIVLLLKSIAYLAIKITPNMFWLIVILGFVFKDDLKDFARRIDLGI